MKKIMVAILSMFALAVLLVAYETENTPSEAKYYDNAKVVRIKSIEGEGFVQRSYEEGYEEATANLPVFEKDTVGTTSGRLGIYLGRMNYLRLDSDTLVEMLTVPQLRETDLVARLEKGALYLDIENLDKEKGIQIQTADCGIFILDKGVYRINVDENSTTEVYVFEGIAEVAGQDSSRNVRENQKIVMARGKLAERPYYFYASEKDDFDHWNETQRREQGYARYGSSRYLQNGYEDYEYEMSRAGRWMYMSEFNSYAWVPYFSNSSWMPYANGRWIYNPYYGYVWTSYDNCGWFTHHYGRWHWDYASGWYWIPGYHWSPAWVSWFSDNDYYGWCPLSWWNRPIVIINNRWDRHYDHRRGIPRHSRSNIIIRKNELTAVNARRVALKRNELEQAGGKLLAYRGAAPVERLGIQKVTVINAHGKAMTFKQNGIVSSEKYKVSTDPGLAGHAAASKSTVYKYNDAGDTRGKYPPRVYRSKDSENETESGSNGYVRSKTGDESAATTRTRSSDSSSSKSESKAGSRGSSTGSTNSTSSSSSSTREAKKKKDQAAYSALLQSENSAGYKSHAIGMSGTSSSPAASDSRSNRYATRYAGATSSNEYRSSETNAAVPANRYAGATMNDPADSRPTTGGYSSRYETEKQRRSGQSHSTFSSGNNAYRSTTQERSNYGVSSSRSNYGVSSSRSNYGVGSSRSNYGVSSSRENSTARGNSSSRSDYSSSARAAAPSRSHGQGAANAPHSSPSTVAKKKH